MFTNPSKLEAVKAKFNSTSTRAWTNKWNKWFYPD
jgi:hypothetical protein